ncbi:MAG: ribosome assembly RNA-binding protein YhbY [Pseudomonadota bacterium]
MKKLKGYQKKYLRGLAHKLKPYVFVGQKGLTESLIQSVSDALEIHELIKVKFLDFKEKEMKDEISSEIERMAECELAGIIGHIATFYKQNKDPQKRVIIIPNKED